MTEKWLPVTGYEGFYEVSDRGQVRSLERTVIASSGRRITVRSRVLKPTIANTGYYSVDLYCGKGKSSRKVKSVHRLVAEAFIGPAGDDIQVCHGNGTRTDNRIENLRYGTRSDNMQDAIRHRTHANFAKTHCIHGHEFTPENTQIRSGGGRKCKACHLVTAQRFTARRKADRAHETGVGK